MRSPTSRNHFKVLTTPVSDFSVGTRRTARSSMGRTGRKTFKTDKKKQEAVWPESVEAALLDGRRLFSPCLQLLPLTMNAPQGWRFTNHHPPEAAGAGDVSNVSQSAIKSSLNTSSRGPVKPEQPSKLEAAFNSCDKPAAILVVRSLALMWTQKAC